MKNRPILFSTDMVKALLAGTKDMTRRELSLKYIINTEPDRYKFLCFNDDGDACFEDLQPNGSTSCLSPIPCPFGQINDRLWVRETFAENHLGHYFKADQPEHQIIKDKWKPSIFMPKYWSRFSLEITNIRMERLHSISEEDAMREGVLLYEGGYKYMNYMDRKYGNTQFIYNLLTAKQSFLTLWEFINKTDNVHRINPWVWVVEFVKISKFPLINSICQSAE